MGLMERERDRILVCQHLTCRKQGAAKVLAELRKVDRSDIAIEGCGCLGRCGSGPNILILPATIWHHHVQPQDTTAIVASIDNE
jgi:(2Fe-2S) ferredoxin